MVIGMMKVTMKVMMLVTLVTISMVIPPMASEILYAETAPMSFEVWALDLKPGFTLRETTIGDRTCYCKNPGFSSSSLSSFNFPSVGTLPASGIPASSFEFIFFTPPAQDQGNNQVQPNITSDNLRTTACGACNKEITFDMTNSGQSEDWSSPGWDENQNYPDGCTCVLTIHMKATWWGYLTYHFAAGSSIKAVNNCAYDRLEFLSPDSPQPQVWCDVNLSQQAGAATTTGEDVDFIFTFISDSGDDNQVAAGFKMTVSGMFYGR